MPHVRHKLSFMFLPNSVKTVKRKLRFWRQRKPTIENLSFFFFFFFHFCHFKSVRPDRFKDKSERDGIIAKFFSAHKFYFRVQTFYLPSLFEKLRKSHLFEVLFRLFSHRSFGRTASNVRRKDRGVEESDGATPKHGTGAKYWFVQFGIRVVSGIVDGGKVEIRDLFLESPETFRARFG